MEALKSKPTGIRGRDDVSLTMSRAIRMGQRLVQEGGKLRSDRRKVLSKPGY